MEIDLLVAMVALAGLGLCFVSFQRKGSGRDKVLGTKGRAELS